MYHSILVPLDGSEYAEWALPTALRLAQVSSAQLNLVTVDVPVPILAGGLATVTPPPTHVTTSIRDYVKHVAERVKRTGAVKVTANVVEPADTWFASIGREIAKQAEQTNADLIVMTTHARALVPRMFLGSVALEVVRWSRAPVLLIKPVAERAPDLSNGVVFKHVLVPLDGTSFSEEVLTPAVELGMLDNAEYTLFQAIEPQPIVGVPVEPIFVPIDAAAFRESRAMAESYISGVADRLRTRNLHVTTGLAIAPNPADGIQQCAQDRVVDLIAMTTHARGGLTRALLGSVANQVVRGAAVPVMLYRPRGE